MKCEICQSRKAVIHIQQVMGKERIDLHLCETCAMERGIAGGEDRIELSITNLLSGLMDVRRGKAGKPKACKQCGYTWERISAAERAGCSECYSTFSREIRSLLHKSYGKVQHRGKYPRRLQTYKTFLVDVAQLKPMRR